MPGTGAGRRSRNGVMPRSGSLSETAPAIVETQPMGKAPAILRAVFGAAVYPASIGAAVWAVIAAMDAGIDSGLAVVSVNVAAAAVVLGLERVLPYRSAWNRSFGDVRTDILHAVLNGSLGEIG